MATLQTFIVQSQVVNEVEKHRWVTVRWMGHYVPAWMKGQTADGQAYAQVDEEGRYRLFSDWLDKI